LKNAVGYYKIYCRFYLKSKKLQDVINVVVNKEIICPICSIPQKPKSVILSFVLTHKEESNNKKEHYRHFQVLQIYMLY